MNFLEKEGNSEPLRFFIEVDRFKDLLLTSSVTWKCWKEADEMTGIQSQSPLKASIDAIHHEIYEFGLDIEDKNKWPCKEVTFEAAAHEVQRIWKRHLSIIAPKKLCSDPYVLLRTKRRMQHLHIYGAEIFTEAMTESLVMVSKAIPKYILSDTCEYMNKCMSALKALPKASELSISEPSSSKLSKVDQKLVTTESLSQLPLEEIVKDKIVYFQFQKFCRTMPNLENSYSLKCLQCIDVFKTMFECDDPVPSAIEDAAWEIYKFFVAAGSTYEVPLSLSVRKVILYKLANPLYQSLFDEIEFVIETIAENSWNAYCESSEFSQLPNLIHEEKRLREGSLPRIVSSFINFKIGNSQSQSSTLSLPKIMSSSSKRELSYIKPVDIVSPVSTAIESPDNMSSAATAKSQLLRTSHHHG